MKGDVITVDYGETNNLSKGFFIRKTYYDEIVPLVKGGGSASGASSGNPSPSDSIPKKNIEELPDNVRESYEKYEESGWKGTRKDQSPKTNAGGEFKNMPPKLPKYDSNGRKIGYREYDVNSKRPNAPRDKERFVRGSDGSTYYTNDHYETFTKIE
jgi:filamentous hemagglutinin